MKKLQLKLNADLLGHKKGAVVTIDCDDQGVAYDNYWFRRMKDSKTDSCVEVVVETNKATKHKKDDKK